MRPDAERLAAALAAVTSLGADDWRDEFGAPESSREAATRFDARGVRIGAYLHWEWTVTEPSEAWEAMAVAGLIGFDDVANPARRFRQQATPSSAAMYRVQDARLPDPADVPSGTIVQRDDTYLTYVSIDEPANHAAWLALHNGASNGAVGRLRSTSLLHPRRVGDVVAFAAAWPKVLAAEQLERQAWETPNHPGTVCWSADDSLWGPADLLALGYGLGAEPGQLRFVRGRAP